MWCTGRLRYCLLARNVDDCGGDRWLRGHGRFIRQALSRVWIIIIINQRWILTASLHCVLIITQRLLSDDVLSVRCTLWGTWPKGFTRPVFPWIGSPCKPYVQDIIAQHGSSRPQTRALTRTLSIYESYTLYAHRRQYYLLHIYIVYSITTILQVVIIDLASNC